MKQILVFLFLLPALVRAQTTTIPLGGGAVTVTLGIAAERYTWPTDTIQNPTLANVQAAINAAPTTGKHLVLARSYNVITGSLAFNKKKIWLDGQGLCLWVRNSGGSDMIAETGDISGSRISGMNLICLSTTGTAGVVASYEITKKDDYSFDRNVVSVPFTDANCYGMIQYSSTNAGGSLRSNRVNISDNVFKSGGRMGAEILAQVAPSGTPYITNLTYIRNHMEDLGRVNSDGHGMGVSIDGHMTGVRVDSNTVVEAKNKAIEIVNTNGTKVRWNTVTVATNSDVTGIAQSAGNSPQTVDLTVENNTVNSSGSPFQFYDVKNLQMRHNRGTNTATSVPASCHGLNMVRVSGGTLVNNTMRTAGYHGAMFNNSGNLTATGNIFSNQYSSLELQAVYLYGAATTGNVITLNKLYKRTGATNANYINEESGAAGSTYTNNTTTPVPN